MSITKQDIQQIINNVRENLKKLDGCIGPHEFKLHDNRYTCLKCKGTVDMVSLLEGAPLVSFHEVESFIVEFVLLVCEFLQAVGFPVLEFTFGGKEPAEEDAEFHGRILARRALACA